MHASEPATPTTTPAALMSAPSRRIQRAQLRFRRRSVAHAERVARILLTVGAPRQPDRAVAVFEIFLLVRLETELVDPAIDGVSAVESEGHNRII